jgi:hypothetical protein
VEYFINKYGGRGSLFNIIIIIVKLEVVVDIKMDILYIIWFREKFNVFNDHIKSIRNQLGGVYIKGRLKAYTAVVNLASI